MIAECPACQARYDVTGHAPGQAARCRCGTVFELREVPTQVDQLTCPACGAGVAEDHPRCDHCDAALLVKACPRCLAHVFHGHAHCPRCGAGVALAAAPLEAAAQGRACPRCASPLLARLLGDVCVEECPACVGLFVDAVAIERIVAERTRARADAVLGAYAGVARAPLAVAGKMYVPCPQCGVVMNRRLFARGSGVVLDVCRGHGTWFDAGELPAVVAFVQNGGLEKAQAGELAAERERLRAGRLDAAFAAIRDARIAGNTGTMAAAHAGLSTGDAFAALLDSLW